MAELVKAGVWLQNLMGSSPIAPIHHAFLVIRYCHSECKNCTWKRVGGGARYSIIRGF